MLKILKILIILAVETIIHHIAIREVLTRKSLILTIVGLALLLILEILVILN